MDDYVRTEGPQHCSKSELSGLIRLVDEEMRKGSNQSVLTDYPLVYADDNLDNIRIIKVNDRIASVVPYIPKNVEMDGSRFSIGIISPTVTDPLHRKKGYARRCLNDCIDRMNTQGIDLSVLWTKLETFPFYEAAGYQGVANQVFSYMLEASDTRRFEDSGEEIIDLDPQNKIHLEAVQKIHEQESAGIIRKEKEYPALFGLPGMKTWLAVSDGAPVGYLVVSHAVNKPGLIEGGGAERAVETLVHAALRRLEGNGSFLGYSYATESVLGNLLDKKLSDKPRKPAGGAMMIRVNNFDRFVRNSAKWLETKNEGMECSFTIEVTETGELFGISMSNGTLQMGDINSANHFNMSRAALTSALFGLCPEKPVKIPGLLEVFFTLDLPIWMLDHS